MTNRSPKKILQKLTQLNQLIPEKPKLAKVKKISSSIWSNDEDIRLAKAVKMNKGKDWEKTAQLFEKKDATQCLHRWQKVLNPVLKKGKWTEEEDELLRKYVKILGDSKWSKVALNIPRRTSKQCRERWNSTISKRLFAGNKSNLQGISPRKRGRPKGSKTKQREIQKKKQKKKKKQKSKHHKIKKIVVCKRKSIIPLKPMDDLLSCDHAKKGVISKQQKYQKLEQILNKHNNDDDNDDDDDDDNDNNNNSSNLTTLSNNTSIINNEDSNNYLIKKKTILLFPKKISKKKNKSPKKKIIKIKNEKIQDQTKRFQKKIITNKPNEIKTMDLGKLNTINSQKTRKRNGKKKKKKKETNNSKKITNNEKKRKKPKRFTKTIIF
ncbi:snRNA-activating protein complex subunit 4 [Anaeramoeba flamelloides]|uniref:snRNA-activating protein complex subunit 4 n=1 Tax=Anaeramoeba flamelloides TaxID=1746091 RepID=A0ABQ8YF69_9EUKA|nr:snRNA-activating protein complex subunit 4 [Anaeramoeba flamelloides]